MKIKHGILTLLVSGLSFTALAQDTGSTIDLSSDRAGASGSTSLGETANDPNLSGTTPRSAQAIPDGLLRRDGVVYFYKHGQPQRIENETKLSEGITVQKDGDVTLKDGTKMTLQDGQMVTLDGQVISAPPAASSPSSPSSSTPSDSSLNTTPDASTSSDGVSSSADDAKSASGDGNLDE